MTDTASISPEHVALLREIVDGVLSRRTGDLQVSAEGLTFLEPGLKVVRALVWAAYRGEDLIDAAGKATFDHYIEEAYAFPKGVAVETARAYAAWFERLRLNIPSPEQQAAA